MEWRLYFCSFQNENLLVHKEFVNKIEEKLELGFFLSKLIFHKFNEIFHSKLHF